MTNIILIGCGPHARRVYLPAIQQSEGAKISLVIELDHQQELVTKVLEKYAYCETYFTEWFEDSLPNKLVDYLELHIKKYNVEGVIIATEPLIHKAYAKWALSKGLNILLDKPITTRKNVVSEITQAKGILQDYNELLADYTKLQEHKETVFMINAQRRFHKGFQFVREKIIEVKEQTNCPINFIQAYHSDGQWRFPSEIVSQDYHPYCYGYGKASHSGYHIFDTAIEFYKSSANDNKIASSFDVYSSILQPKGFFEQLESSDYDRLFVDQKEQRSKWNTDEFYEKCTDFGELDLSSIITLKKGHVPIGNININLIHNGYAGRTWINPGSDLYKGNGRIKHESYHIQQGPFQSIQIHAYQGSDQHDLDNGIEAYLGGKNHFDVYVFRNPLLSKGKSQPEAYKLTDFFEKPEEGKESNIIMEQVKFKVVEQFVDFIGGSLSKQSVNSQITEHKTAVQIMSGFYRSHINAIENKLPVMSYDLD
ncbi:Gfo/Idh/MocA family oxidoreductase [Carboxylicivirga sp. N1Y90]|uniref:Gfo/Idh/MocA family oxidoreductase n=1 Tax=Carboxylicivirga fragile TaxID=3417571 RepID=UPI003D345419|nr:Gfo/Idh/MocA family oxidoreductase [Marinilabiliaceae bacterium N1Y90]